MTDIPKDVRERVQSELWRQADELVWDSLGNVEKAKHYEHWTTSAAIGGELQPYLDARSLRVYIKDTLLKAYTREKARQHEASVLRVAGAEGLAIKQRFIKPHAVALENGALAHWGRADDWKVIVTTAFERARELNASESSLVFFRANPRFAEADQRAVVEDAARRLGVTRCAWFD